MRLVFSALAVLALASPIFAAGRAMSIDDLLGVKSVSDPQVSPDGKLVVYVVSELDRATEKSNADLYLIPTAGGEPRRLTTSTGADNHPAGAPTARRSPSTRPGAARPRSGSCRSTAARPAR